MGQWVYVSISAQMEDGEPIKKAQAKELVDMLNDCNFEVASYSRFDHLICDFEDTLFSTNDLVTEIVEKFGQEHPDIVIMVQFSYDTDEAYILYVHGDEAEICGKIVTWQEPERIKWRE